MPETLGPETLQQLLEHLKPLCGVYAAQGEVLDGTDSAVSVGAILDEVRRRADGLEEVARVAAALDRCWIVGGHGGREEAGLLVQLAEAVERLFPEIAQARTERYGLPAWAHAPRCNHVWSAGTGEGQMKTGSIPQGAIDGTWGASG